MKIETKYNKKDEVWFMSENKAICETIDGIGISYYDSPHSEGETELNEEYTTENRDWWHSVDTLFPSKEELLKSL